MTKYKPLQLIEIIWDDATSDDGWNYDGIAKDDNGLGECRTVGYFLRWTGKTIQLAPTISLDPKGVAGVWSIPRSGIRRVTKLKGGR